LPDRAPTASAASAAAPSAWALNRRAVWARTYVRLVGSLREPAWIMTDAVFPALTMASFVLLYRALGAPRSYETLAVLGGIMATYWINVLWGMGAQLYWEKQSGQLQLYFVAPCSRLSLLTGMALGGVLMTTARAVFSIAIGFGLLGVRVAAFDGLQLLLVFIVTMAALYALGMAFASLFLLYGREGWLGSFFEDHDVQFLFALPSMIVATIFVSLPFVAREVIPTLREIGDEQEQAARTLGASGWQTFWRITLPSIRWAVIYGVILTAARCLGEYGAVAVVSGRIQGETETATLRVEERYDSFDLAGAYAIAIVLALIAIAVLLVMTLVKPREGTT